MQSARASSDCTLPPPLRWVNDREPGLRRVRRGRGFAYLDARGRAVRDERVLRRIRLLAIPPAYGEVWICSHSNGHLQATGRDARGRKQYRYHLQWQAVRDALKFEHLRDFGRALPTIRRRVRRVLDTPGGATLARVVAAIVRLLDTTCLRIGNPEYLRENGSCGLSTLRKRHVEPRGDQLRLRFIGKGGKPQAAHVEDPRVARLVRRCQDLPGQALFRYLDDDGRPQAVESTHVNAWLAEVAGVHVTAKDFRTWHGSVQALSLALDACNRGAEGGAAPRPAKAVIAEVARRLGNTPAVCRKSYIHPRVLALLEGIDRDGAPRVQMSACRWVRHPPVVRGLRVDERRLLALIGRNET